MNKHLSKYSGIFPVKYGMKCRKEDWICIGIQILTIVAMTSPIIWALL